MNLFFIVFLIFGLFAVGFGGESFGQGPPPGVEPGEDVIYAEVEITDIILDGLEAIGDGIKSFFKWICFWCDD